MKGFVLALSLVGLMAGLTPASAAYRYDPYYDGYSSYYAPSYGYYGVNPYNVRYSPSYYNPYVYPTGYIADPYDRYSGRNWWKGLLRDVLLGGSSSFY